MRYIVKFVNGIWQVFDRHTFTAARARPLFREAAADAAYLNSRPPRKANHVVRP